MVNMDYFKCCVANRYFPFSDLTTEKKTMVMKSLLKDKIIKNIYYNEETLPHQTDRITFTPIGLDIIRTHFFELNMGMEDIPYDWEYWQKISDEASIELTKWHQQEKDRLQQLELENNKSHMDMIDWVNSYIDKNNFNPVPPFYLLQRQGIIPRLAVSIEDLCKILGETGGDESEIKKLQELIDNNNSDTKKRARLQVLKNAQGKGGVIKSKKTKETREFIIYAYKRFIKENPNAKQARCYEKITDIIRKNPKLSKHLEDSNLEEYVRKIIYKYKKSLKN